MRVLLLFWAIAHRIIQSTVKSEHREVGDGPRQRQDHTRKSDL